MERLIINTGMDEFLMPERILRYTETEIETVRTVASSDDAADWIWIETAAQTAALHTRIGIDFKQHAFLLTIDRFRRTGRPTGECRVKAVRTGAAGTAFRYDVTGTSSGDVCFSGSLMTAVTDGPSAFDQKRLSDHYKKIVSCLMKNSEKD